MFRLFAGRTDELKPILSGFVSTIAEDTRLKSFFKNSDAIQKTAESLLNHFKNIGDHNRDSLASFYYALGRKHAAMGIPFSTFENMTDSIHRNLLTHFISHRYSHILRLDTFSYFLINNVAAGYLEYEKEVFKDRLRFLSRHAKDTEFLKNYIEWFLMLHTVLMAKDEEYYAEIRSDKPNFLSLPESEYGTLLSAVSRMEKQFSSELSSFTYQLDKKDYKHCITSYARLKECFFTITHLISVLEQAMIQNINAKDTLTGAYTRKKMNALIEKAGAMSQAEGKNFCVAITDIDHFKRVNDTYGHSTGDTVLTAFASALIKHASETGGSVVRYGGEEFVLILPSSNLDESFKLLEDLRLIIEMIPIKIDTGMIHITASFGVTEAKGTDMADNTPACLIMRADEKLYDAKRNGRNRVEC